MTAPAPSRDDTATMTCPVCQHPFTPAGRQRYCGSPCRKTAFRRRHQDPPGPLAVPAARPRRERTVYECSQCGERLLGVFSSPWVLEAGWRCDGRKRCKAFGAGVARLEAGYRCVPRLAL